MSSVQIAVRMRPFNDREKKMGCKKCVEMQGQTVEITDPNDGKKTPFAFTFAYDSFDKDSANYANQQTVFDDLGASYLENAWSGFNCSIFAYGQTGSGKSYSMTGYGADQGIIPLGMAEMFRRINTNEDSSLKFKVEVSYLEVYMEKIKDLFNPKQSVPSLKVRESKKMGIYVEGLTRERAGSYEDVERLMEQGNKLRAVAATAMNATSSRSHSVLTVFFTKTKVDGASATDMTAKINLVDLAGSERQDKTGASGDRLKEGSAINSSLTALGNVIEALADRADKENRWEAKHPGKPYGGKPTIIPYRDSQLTRILQESLGGNAKTIMVAAVSPADNNYNESMSTLRYAQRASKIKNKAIVNESPNDKLIRELREELERLKAALEHPGTGGGASAPAGSEEAKKMAEQAASEKEAADAELAELKRILEQQEQQIKEMNMTKEEVDAEIQKDRTRFDARMNDHLGPEDDRTVPHLVNLNEDDYLSETLVFALKKNDSTTFGKDAENDIVVKGGSQIRPLHCTIRMEGDGPEGKCFIVAAENAPVFVKGKKLMEEMELHHNDRIIFGNRHFYKFIKPVEGERIAAERAADPSLPPETIFDYEFAHREYTEHQSQHKVEVREGESEAEAHERERLEDLLMKVHTDVTEANALSSGLNKPLRFELKLIKDMTKLHGETLAKIEVTHLNENNRKAMWSNEKFTDRLYAMKDVYYNLTEFGHDNIAEGGVDPWDDPPEHEMIGVAHVLLMSLVDCVTFDLARTPIIDAFGKTVGLMSAKLVPISPDGEEEPDNDDWAENGTRMDVAVEIIDVKGLPARLCSEVFARFRWGNDTKFHESLPLPPVDPPSINHTLNWRKVVTIEHVTELFLSYLRDEDLIVEIWGRPPEEEKKKHAEAAKTKAEEEDKKVESKKPPAAAAAAVVVVAAESSDKDTPSADEGEADDAGATEGKKNGDDGSEEGAAKKSEEGGEAKDAWADSKAAPASIPPPSPEKGKSNEKEVIAPIAAPGGIGPDTPKATDSNKPASEKNEPKAEEKKKGCCAVM